MVRVCRWLKLDDLGIISETVSPSAGAPTLSLLLEQPQDNKHAAIEHIKSQLVQIEHQLKGISRDLIKWDIENLNTFLYD